MFSISFKTPDEIFAFPPVWYPASIQFSNYRVLFKDGDAWTVWNSLVLASVSTVFAMILGIFEAGLYMKDYLSMSNAVRAGARQVVEADLLRLATLADVEDEQAGAGVASGVAADEGGGGAM